MISFIIATYNSESVLPACLEAFQSQKDKNFELIIIDGASSDSTTDIIKQYSSIVNYWSSQKDQGIYDAWNKGLEKANGDWIVFLGSDDKLESPDSVSNISSICENNSEVHMIYGLNKVVNDKGEQIRIHGEDWDAIKNDFYNGIMKVPHQGLLHHKAIFEGVGNFDIQFRISGDYDMLLRALEKGFKIKFTNQFSEVIVQEGGISHNYATRMQSLDEVARSMQSFGLPRSRFAFKKYRMRTQFVRILSKIFGVKFWDRFKKSINAV